jgi:hypothetical protein
MNHKRRSSRVSRILLAGAVVAICFAAGVLSVLATQESETPAALLTESPPALSGSLPFSGEEDQIVVLILGSEKLFSKQAALLAVWLATYRPPGRDLYLFGFPIDWRPEGARNSSLRQAFEWSEGGDVAPAFIDLLPMRPDVVVALDPIAFAGLVDFVGGVRLDDPELMTGMQAAASIGRLKGQPEEMLMTQASMLQDLVGRAAALESTPDLTPLLEQIPEHAYSSLPAVGLVSNFSAMLPINPERVHIQLLGQQ